MPATPEPATVVLVHSPLVGPATWQPVAAALRARGHAVAVPSLAEALASGAPHYPRLAAAVARAVDDAPATAPVVLVAHSGAGALLPAGARAAGREVRGAVYVDAVLPHPGRGWFDTVPAELGEQLGERARDGLLPPWDTWFPPGTVEELLPDAALRARFRAELPRVPLAYFAEAAPEVPDPAPGHSAYLRLSAPYAGAAERAERAGWRVVRRDAHHLAVLTDPAGVAATLAELCAELCAAGRPGERRAAP